MCGWWWLVAEEKCVMDGMNGVEILNHDIIFFSLVRYSIVVMNFSITLWGLVNASSK